MEFILANQNWFYLYGIIYVINTIYDIVKRKKNKDINFSVDLRDRSSVDDLVNKVKKESNIIESVFGWINCVWIIFGFWQKEIYFFLFLAFLVFIVPILSTLSDSKSAFSEFKNSGSTVINSDMMDKHMDVKRYKRFFSFLGFVEIALVIVIFINHFKLFIFYAL